MPIIQPSPAPHPRTPLPHLPPPRHTTSFPRVAPPTVQPPPSPLPRVAPSAKPFTTTPHFSLYPDLLAIDFATCCLYENQYRHLLKTDQNSLWENGFSKELARLGNGRSKDATPGTNTISWIHRNEIPQNKKPTYTRICANYRPQKEGPYRVRCTLVDIKDFYLQFNLPDPEYITIPFALIPPDIINDYNLQSKVSNGNVYAKVTKGMYGLPQAGKLAHDDLVKHLPRGGYFPTTYTSGLFNQSDLDHFLNLLRKRYVITQDEGTRFNGIHLKWNYQKRECELSIPEYCFKALTRFKHPLPSKPQHSPYPYQPPKYGQSLQYATPILKIGQ